MDARAAVGATAALVHGDDLNLSQDRGRITPEIAPLVHALRTGARIITKGSCWGHRKKPAWVDVAVHGMVGLRAVVERINLVDRDTGYRTSTRHPGRAPSTREARQMASMR